MEYIRLRCIFANVFEYFHNRFEYLKRSFISFVYVLIRILFVEYENIVRGIFYNFYTAGCGRSGTRKCFTIGLLFSSKNGH